MLRQCDVKENVIQAFRVRGITDRLLFINLDDTIESLRDTCKEALQIDVSINFEHKLEIAKISKAWNSAKVTAETKQKIDAVHRAHGEPVQMLEGDWANMIRAFKLKYGQQIHPSRLPAQSYFEAYEERLANTTWKAETLAHVVSLQEEESQKALRPEPSRSVGIHLDSSLSIQTQRRFMAKMPTNVEELLTKYKVMANMFLLAKMRQPSRHLYKVLEVNTFSDFLDELLSDRNFLMETADDEHLVLPPWNECLNYEFQIRKNAIGLCMEEGFALKESLWHTLADKEHRMQHWILKLTIANSRGESSKMQKMEQRMAVLENRLKNRSRSPRRQQNQRALPASQQMLAPPASSSQPKGKAKGQKGKGKGKNKGGKTQSSNSSTFQGFRNFQALYKIGWSARKLFAKDTCWKFQSNLCQDSGCTRKHVCVGCGKAVPYDSCGCLESSIPRA